MAGLCVDVFIYRCLLLVSYCNLHSRLLKECRTCPASTSSIVIWQLATACMYQCVTDAYVGLSSWRVVLTYVYQFVLYILAVVCLAIMAICHVQHTVTSVATALFSVFS